MTSTDFRGWIVEHNDCSQYLIIDKQKSKWRGVLLSTKEIQLLDEEDITKKYYLISAGDTFRILNEDSTVTHIDDTTVRYISSNWCVTLRLDRFLRLIKFTHIGLKNPITKDIVRIL